ncbi:alpha-1A adrenergic receptor-like [Lytechinus variegatus]|uniref:alpha-1A adrenergic receptor-like n=1 Tax=Lytechinus variegatus TaxID=7654 RepID=UPI001BB1036C|nr:alpha-1A adrenergic receptor-like [Lytechinus variegatus]
MTVNSANADHNVPPSWDTSSDLFLDSTTNATNGTLVYNIPRLIISSALLLIIIMAVIFGNILVLLAVLMERKLRTVTNYFIFNLAVADLLLGTLVLPFSGTLEVISYWPFGQKFCDVWAAVDVLCCTASIISLCVISIDRYIGVTRPLKHKLIVTPRRALLVIVLVWILSFAIAVGPLFGWRPDKDNPLQCPLSDSIDYVFFSVSGSFYIPLIVIIVLYIRIYQTVSGEYKSRHSGKSHGSPSTSSDKGSPNGVVLRMHRGSVQTPPGHQLVRRQNSANNLLRPSRTASQRSVTFNREKKVAKTLGIVVSVFFLCWFPFFFLLPLTSACTSCYVPPLAFNIFFWLGYCNSFMNPLIYAVSNMTFRRAFKKILSCQYCQDCPCGPTSAPRKIYSSSNTRTRTRTRDSLQYNSVPTCNDYDMKGQDEVLQVVVGRRASSASEGHIGKDEIQELLPRSALRRTLSDAGRPVDCKVLYARLAAGADASLSTITEVQEQPEHEEQDFHERGHRIYHFSSSSEDLSLCSSPSHSSRNPESSSASEGVQVTGPRGANLFVTNAVINHTESDSTGTPKHCSSVHNIETQESLESNTKKNNNTLITCRQRATREFNNRQDPSRLISIETSL